MPPLAPQYVRSLHLRHYLHACHFMTKSFLKTSFLNKHCTTRRLKCMVLKLVLRHNYSSEFARLRNFLCSIKNAVMIKKNEVTQLICLPVFLYLVVNCVSIWTTFSRDNYEYTQRLHYRLCAFSTVRYGRVTALSSVMVFRFLEPNASGHVFMNGVE